jgi:glucan-binding YG repeat protein
MIAKKQRVMTKFEVLMHNPTYLEPKHRDYAITYRAAIEQEDGGWVYDNGMKVWYNDAGYVHRDDGPAVINPDGKIRWYDRSCERPFEKWCEQVNIADEAKMLLRLQYG